MTKYIKITGPVYSQKRHRHTNKGFVYDPSSKDKKKVIPQIVEQFMEKTFIDAVLLEMNFYIQRPKSHWNKYSLKASAPKYKTTKPDLDNHCKFYMDCMSGIVFKDDNQIISLVATKQFCDEYQDHYVEIVITDFK